jgi:hypothetical protein
MLGRAPRDAVRNWATPVRPFNGSPTNVGARPTLSSTAFGCGRQKRRRDHELGRRDIGRTWSSRIVNSRSRVFLRPRNRRGLLQYVRRDVFENPRDVSPPRRQGIGAGLWRRVRDISKSSAYNLVVLDAYDGRHNSMTADRFRSYVTKLRTVALE